MSIPCGRKQVWPREATVQLSDLYRQHPSLWNLWQPYKKSKEGWERGAYINLLKVWKRRSTHYVTSIDGRCDAYKLFDLVSLLNKEGIYNQRIVPGGQLPLTWKQVRPPVFFPVNGVGTVKHSPSGSTVCCQIFSLRFCAYNVIPLLSVTWQLPLVWTGLKMHQNLLIKSGTKLSSPNYHPSPSCISLFTVYSINILTTHTLSLSLSFE